MAIRKPKGTFDMLPSEAAFWNRFKDTASTVFGRYGYLPIETPLFEQTDLFVRGIGAATDVVGKEMFTAISGANLATLLEKGPDANVDSFSLRPEGTAGVVRAVVENGLVVPGGSPIKLMYAGPMFRAERPQKGRQRQFNQIGIECLGAEDPTIDAEGIIMLVRFFEELGIATDSLRLLVNSMGCAECRPAYRDAVRAHILEHVDDMCDECRQRAETNPLRAFDCKHPECMAVMATAPTIIDALCDDCREHYEAVKALLDGAGIGYVEDSTLVRGLDYYTRTVFEVQTGDERAQNALGGGGRYDGLVEEIGGKPTPGFGFALGYERCRNALVDAGMPLPDPVQLDAYVACVDDSLRGEVFTWLQALRDAGLKADCDHQGRSLKSQFKQAGKHASRTVLVLGPDELAAGTVTLRDMDTHDEHALDINATMDFLRAHAGAVRIEDFLAFAR